MTLKILKYLDSRYQQSRHAIGWDVSNLSAQGLQVAGTSALLIVILFALSAEEVINLEIGQDGRLGLENLHLESE
jgi:hypothetical protein